MTMTTQHFAFGALVAAAVALFVNLPDTADTTQELVPARYEQPSMQPVSGGSAGLSIVPDGQGGNG